MLFGDSRINTHYNNLRATFSSFWKDRRKKLSALCWAYTVVMWDDNTAVAHVSAQKLDYRQKMW